MVCQHGLEIVDGRWLTLPHTATAPCAHQGPCKVLPRLASGQGHPDAAGKAHSKSTPSNHRRQESHGREVAGVQKLPPGCAFLQIIVLHGSRSFGPWTSHTEDENVRS